MPSLRSIWKLLQYIPVVLEITRAVRPHKQEEHPAGETQQELDDFKKNVYQRVEEVEIEQARLRGRLREAESTIALLQVILYGGGGVIALLTLILLVTVILMAINR